MTTVTTPREVEFVYDDGGRAAAGFSDLPRSCAADSFAVAMGRPYADVWQELADVICQEVTMRYPMVVGVRVNPDLGLSKDAGDHYLEKNGWTFHHSQGFVTASDLPREGTFLLFYVMGEKGNMGHFSALVDGLLRDDTDTRHLPIFGWWSR